MSTDAADSGGGEDSVAARVLVRDPRLLSIVLLSGIGILSTQTTVPALPAIQTGLAVSDARIGLVLSAFFLPSVIGTPLLGAVCDIYGRRRVAMASLAGFGTAGLAQTLAPTFGVLLALRVVQGVCFAGLTPLSVAFIGDVFRGPAGTTAQGIRLSGNGLVVVIAPAIAGVLAEIAWNYPFALYAVSFPALLVVYRYFPDDDVATETADESVLGAFGEWGRGLKHALDDRALLVLILGGIVLFGIRYAMLTVAPLLATREIGLTASTVGASLSLLGVIRIFASPQAGRFAVWASRKTAFVLTMGLVAASMALFAVADSLPVFLVGIAAFSVGMSLFNPTLNDAIAAGAPAENRAGVVSTMAAGKNLANTIGPAIAGALLALTDFRTVFVFAVAVTLFYVALLVFAFERGSY